MDWFTITIVVILLILIAVFLIRKKLLLILNKATHIALVIFVILTLIALFIPGLFSSLANSTFEANGTLTSIRNFDKSISINTIVQPGKNFLDQIINLFNPTVTPTTTPAVQNIIKGPLETQLYPELVNDLATIYRLIIIFVSILGIYGVIYLSFIDAGATEAIELSEKVQKLEKRLQILENSTKTGEL